MPRTAKQPEPTATAAQESRRANLQHSTAMKKLADDFSKALGYEAARNNRWRSQQSRVLGSGDKDLGANRPALVSFGRWLDQNDAIARALVQRMVDLIVGPEITPTAAVGTPAAKAVELWTERKDTLDVSGERSMGDLQRAFTKECLTTGDAGAVQVTTPVFGIQLIDNELIGGLWNNTGTPQKVPSSGRGKSESPNLIYDGVEKTPEGRTVAYWISEGWDQSGSLPKVPTKGIPAESFCFMALKDRLSQSRGAPLLASAMERLGMLNDYHVAVQTAATIHAVFAAVLKTAKPGTTRSVLKTGTTSNPSKGTGAGENADGTRGSETVRDLMKLGPGALLTLAHDDEFQTVQGNQPVAVFDQFNMAMLRLICASIGVPVEVALLDLGKANFSVARLAELQTQNTIMPLRKLLVDRLLKPLFRALVRSEMGKGLSEKGATEADYLDVTWRGPARKMIDPAVETETNIKLIENNLASKDDIIEIHGGDPEQVRKDRQRERRAEEAMNIVPPGAKSPSPPAAAGPSPRGGGGSNPPGGKPETPDPKPDDSSIDGGASGGGGEE